MSQANTLKENWTMQLKLLFLDKFDCYAQDNTKNDIPAMTEEAFAETVYNILVNTKVIDDKKTLQ
jgi:hypothetical protein